MSSAGEYDKRDRELLIAVLAALLLGLIVSSVVAAIENEPFVVSVIIALTFLWSWVALGMCAGLFAVDRSCGPLSRWQSHVSAQLAGLVCGLSVFLGVHEKLQFSSLVRFNPDLIAYYLVLVQLFYFFLAAIVSLFVALVLMRGT